MKSKPTDIRVQQTVFLKALEDSGNEYEDFKCVLGKNHVRYSNQTFRSGTELYSVKQIHYFLDSTRRLYKLKAGKISIKCS